LKAVSPGSLEEALEALAETPDLRPAAGCTDLLVTDGLGRAQMDRVLNLLSVLELRGIREVPGGEGAGVEIGATASFTALRRHPGIRERWPALAAAAGVIGGWQIQNRATVGGNVCNASPAGDSLPVLLVLGATVRVAGPHRRREISYGTFHTGYRKTALRPGEIVTGFHLPLPAPDTVQRFCKVGTREAQAISKVVVALSARVEDETIRELRLAAGSVAPTPIRLIAAEGEAAGQPPTPATADRVAEAAAAAVTPIDDVRSTADYRRFALDRVVRRMVLSLGSAAAIQKRAAAGRRS
jgi:CO/xanthine dehydrogenase FAD-binding subunit